MMKFLILLLAHVLAALLAAGTSAQYLPPTLPKEHMYQFTETYLATRRDNGAVFSTTKTVGSQYWSFRFQSQRGVISAGPGIDKGTTTAAINSLTVTNYDDRTDKGSLVVDLVTKTCSATKNEGGAAYQGYDFYRTFIAAMYQNPDVVVSQINVTNFVRSGQSYGPASVWSFTPGTGKDQIVCPEFVLTAYYYIIC